MKLVSVSQMRAIEKESDSKGATYAQLMQNAGRGLAEVIHALGQEHGWDHVSALVGSGNNGGDALVALAWLADAGWRTHVHLLNRKAQDDELVVRYLQAGGELSESAHDDEALAGFLSQADVFVDGLLGTGIKLPLRKEAARVLHQINRIISDLDPPPFIVAVDCPSGVDCDSGAAAPETIRADLTLTMAAAKQGLLKLPAFEFVGGLRLIDIGLPNQLDTWDEIRSDAADWETVAALLPARTPASHKGTFGTAFVVAGSASYSGAALLAGKAAYRVGAGLVTMAIPEPLHVALAGHLPEATWVQLPHENGFISEAAVDEVLNNLSRATAMLIGPGLGDKPATEKFFEKLIPAIKIPLVIDADGLRLLSHSPLLLGEGSGVRSDWSKKLNVSTVLTPHPGEMSALTGLSKEEIQSDREKIARKFAMEWGQVIVLKGAFTVVANSTGHITIIPVATPALAHAGTGDVLAGMIAGLLAQGLTAYDSAIAGAFIHAQAGVFAEEKLGTSASVLASDVLDSISEVLAEF